MNTNTKKFIIILSIIVVSIIGRIVYISLCEYYDYNDAINENSIEKCREFVKKYPNSDRLSTLYSVMAQIEIDFYQYKLNKEYKDVAYDDICYYIATYPEGQYINEVNIQKEYFDDKLAYEEAKANNSSYAWNKYINEYPNGKFITEAQTNYKKAIKHEENLRDYDDYILAKNSNTKESWQLYLNQHPNGRYKRKAEESIQLFNDLEYYSNYSLSNGALPYKNIYGANYREAEDLSKITVTAPKTSDVVVTARLLNSDKIKGHIYVRANRTASFYIPEGRYTISFYYGRGWYPKKEIVGKHGTLYGGFLLDESVGKDEDVYYPANQGYSYTLQTTYNGNFSTEPSSTYEMF